MTVFLTMDDHGRCILPLQGEGLFGGWVPSLLGWAKVGWPFRPEGLNFLKRSRPRWPCCHIPPAARAGERAGGEGAIGPHSHEWGYNMALPAEARRIREWVL